MDHNQTKTVSTRFVLSEADRTWVRDMDLPFAPFPGLGIRIDAYDVVNIVKVIFDDSDGSVTCVVEFEGQENTAITASRLDQYGFTESAPAAPRMPLSSPVRVNLITFAQAAQWSKEVNLPFSPFAGLCVRIGEERLLKIFTIVVGSEKGGEVECYASFEGVDAETIPEDECAALGLERDYR